MFAKRGTGLPSLDAECPRADAPKRTSSVDARPPGTFRQVCEAGNRFYNARRTQRCSPRFITWNQPSFPPLLLPLCVNFPFLASARHGAVFQ